MLAERQTTFIFLRSIIPYTFMLRLIVGSVQTNAHASQRYLALTSNLSVEIDLQNFTSAINDDGRLSKLGKKYQTIFLQFENDTTDLCSATTLIKAKLDKSVIEFPCTCFSRAGYYNVVLKNATSDNDKTVISTVHIRWPSVNVSIPSSYTALSEDGISVNISYKLGCVPNLLSLNRTSALEIRYTQLSGVEKSFRKLAVLPIRNWWAINSPLKIPCNRFDRAGEFSVVLINDLDETKDVADNVVAESNPMTVVWYTNYRLKMPPGSIFPCPTSGVAVSYDRPSCEQASGSDRVRLYGIIVNETSKSKQPIYIGEEKIVDSKSVLNFGCNYFDLIYLEYCFKYFTASDDGIVKEHAVQCVPTQQTKFMPVHGHWSDWKDWGPCTVTCDIGVQHRVRLCDRPKPKYYGKFCQGDGIETKICDSTKCPNITTNYVDINKSLSLTSPCQCGCLLTKEETIVIGSFACDRLSLWSIEAPSKSVIKVRFITYRLADPSRESLKIRQSLNDTGRLLFDSKQSVVADDDIVVSNGNHMRVEYFSDGDFETKEKLAETNDNNKKGALWKGVLIKITFVDADLESLSTRATKISSLLFLILAGSGAFVILLTLCVAGCLLFKNAKKKLLCKCRLIKSHSCGSIKEIDPLMDDVGSMDTSTAPTTSTTGGRNDVGGHQPSTVEGRTIRVTIESDVSCDPVPEAMNHNYAVPAKKSSKFLENGQNLPQIPEEIMTSSTHTQSTRLSTLTQKSGELSPPPATIGGASTKTVRSIGIQLSSPALPLKRRFSFGSKVSIGTPNNNNCNGHSHYGNGTNNNNNNNKDDRCESPTNFSIAGTEQDFEYDYSEYAVPGSILNPDYRSGVGADTFLQSDISIDDIIAQCDLMKSPSPADSSLEKSSVSTQIQNDSMDFSVKLPKKSMKQFHFL